jgi:hypothetical protein
MGINWLPGGGKGKSMWLMAQRMDKDIRNRAFCHLHCTLLVGSGRAAGLAAGGGLSGHRTTAPPGWLAQRLLTPTRRLKMAPVTPPLQRYLGLVAQGASGLIRAPRVRSSRSSSHSPPPPCLPYTPGTFCLVGRLAASRELPRWLF